jgi:hypothetical protein
VNGVTSPFPPVPPVGHVTHMRAANPLFVGVFVEGPDDVEMWNRWLKAPPLACDGGVGVRKAIADLRACGLKGCVGIVDADLDRARRCLVSDDDIVVSEKHDHECDLLCSRAIDTLLLSLPQAERELHALARPDASVRDAIRARAIPFGLLRWVFDDRGIEFPSRLTPNNEEFLSRRTWKLGVERLLDTASSLLSITRSALDAEIDQRRALLGEDEWLICNGHDVVALLRLVFATVHCAAERCRSEKTVAWALRNSLDSTDLQTFSMWQQLLSWERRNTPFVARRA